ncbi:hypothetical protein PR048_023738 [Dryococelus australis]|uniref:Uncharacterized protein n=1 Tax=Dryococelus australis TaxID=614101 RepID=A0ABQ9GUY4_9NEOP|nr:hypothetical protein PR048_023738 [Dryococelus australis]
MRNLIMLGNSFCLTTHRFLDFAEHIELHAHFVNENFEFISVLLVCSVMSAHTSENLAAEIKRIVTDWGIENKIVLAWKHLGCFVHTLNLIVNDALRTDLVSNIIHKVKTIVGHFKRSCVVNEKLMT